MLIQPTLSIASKTNTPPVATHSRKMSPMADYIHQIPHFHEFPPPKNPLITSKNPNTPPVATLLNPLKVATGGHLLALPPQPFLRHPRDSRIACHVFGVPMAALKKQDITPLSS